MNLLKFGISILRTIYLPLWMIYCILNLEPSEKIGTTVITFLSIQTILIIYINFRFLKEFDKDDKKVSTLFHYRLLSFFVC